MPGATHYDEDVVDSADRQMHATTGGKAPYKGLKQ